MWANTMSTSELGANLEAMLEAMDLPAPAAALDVAAIARLANEFFAALPANMTPAAAPGAALPAPIPAVTDSVAPPATPASAAAWTPDNPGAVPVYGAPGFPAYIRNAAEPAPLNAPPSFSGAGNLFSFPSVPGMPPLPDAAAPVVPNIAQPAWGVPSADAAPSAPDAMPDVSALAQLADQPWLAEHAVLPENAAWIIPGVASPLASAPRLPLPSGPFSFPNVPAMPTPSAATAPDLPGYSAARGRGSPFEFDVSFPLTSDLFSLPGVPGAQSLPGTPVLPSSPPEEVPSPPTNVSGQNGADALARTETPGPAATAPAAPGAASAPAQPRTAAYDFSPRMTPDLALDKRLFDPYSIRRDFPILQERVHGHPLIWLDNAATTQKPNAVIDRLSYFYQHENSNVHRAAHTLAARATDAYESAREKVRRFINASSTREIVFVRGTTEGVNLVAQAWGRRNVEKDDEVVITWLEHHANIVPWQQLCAEKGARLRVAPVDDRGDVILDQYEKLLTPRTRIVAFTQVSNALGTVTPAREMIEMAHRHGALVLLDGAQSIAHMRTNVQALDCDFFVFSGHKIFGPTGIGVVYGKADILDNTPPWQGGGSMIVDVTFEKTVYQQAPARFEAGTGNIADAVGLGAALDYLDEVGIENVNRHEHVLLNYATAALTAIPGLRLIGTPREKAGVISFVLDRFRTEDVGVALNQEGIAVRAGHHCAQPILRRFGVESTVRPSLALYNTTEDIDALVAAILRMQAGRR